jgi:hypothetical protein
MNQTDRDHLHLIRLPNCGFSYVYDNGEKISGDDSGAYSQGVDEDIPYFEDDSKDFYFQEENCSIRFDRLLLSGQKLIVTGSSKKP